MTSVYNLAFVKLAKRAERQDDATLAKTFVDFGAVVATLSGIDHHLIFGRRGTGKTHLLTVLRKSQEDLGISSIQIDMRNLGSSGGMYADSSVALPQRATRLLIDVLAAIHARLLEIAVSEGSQINLGRIGPALDEFFEVHSTVKVVGTTTIETFASAESSTDAESKLGLSASIDKPLLTAEFGAKVGSKESVNAKKSIVGQEVFRVSFGNVGNALKKIIDNLPNKKLWILLDEWSEVPAELQPYLADLVRRALFPIQGITVKIAAIEQRSRFLISEKSFGHIGIEVGADVSTALNLDDFMVFENDSLKAVEFFKTLIYKHTKAELESIEEQLKTRISSIDRETGNNDLDNLGIQLNQIQRAIQNNSNTFISSAFTQTNAFDEIVRACEGVPRDAINILSVAAQRSNDNLIAMSDVRKAAQTWYQGSKDSAVSSRDDAKELLTWIIDKVIKERQAKGFLLEANIKDELIDFLYDERVLHVLRKGISAKDQPGKRFNVYGIDYGCYVDLISTVKEPQALLDIGDDSSELISAVPQTDLRSIRRCILDLPEFYSHL